MPDTTAAWARSSVFDDILFQFEKDFRAGKNPDPEAYLLGEGENRWRLLLELLHSNLELRLRAGEKLCVKDYLLNYPELVQRPGDILSLLAVELRFLNEQGHKPRLEDYEQDYGKLIPSSLKPLFEHPSPKQTDQNVGKLIANRYRLIKILGQGGMGTVYLAEQSEPVKRQVALKLIKAGIDSRSYITRFEAERQALAVMDHPNIARVYDGGTTELQQPYFVMELVQGIPITQYCDQQRLNPKARLELFVQICQAVQHAHQKGIIHRDLKPGNVLVTLIDGKPVPKVIDFGLAKAMEQPLTDETIEDQGVVGTPAYMSPEQADPDNQDVDTRTDVYALGVILYELLTGNTPIDAKQFRRGALLEMLRMVREVDPPRPSTKLSSADELPSIAANRAVEPKELLSWVRGDVDWIVMKALEKDRNRRYETANGFAADVQRYLSGDAVLAHPPGRRYRAMKFVKRNRVQVVAAGLVLVALVAGIIGTSIGLYLANEARVAEKQEKENAQNKEAEANAVIKFFADHILAAGRPKGQEGGLGKDVSLLAAIEASLPTLETAFKNQPFVEAKLRTTIADTLLLLRETHNAEKQYERAETIYREQLGPEHTSTLLCMHNLAICYDLQGRRTDSLRINEKILAVRKRILPVDHPDTLKSINNLAHNYFESGLYIDAQRLTEDLYVTRKRVLPLDHPDTIGTKRSLAHIYARLNKHPEVMKLLEEVVADYKRVLPEDHPSTLACMSNLANTYGALNRQEDALKLREQVLAAKRRILPANHEDLLRAQTNLAASYMEFGRNTEALPLLQDSFERKLKVLPPDHQYLYSASACLATCYIELKRDTDAKATFDRYLRHVDGKEGIPSEWVKDMLARRNNLLRTSNDLQVFREAAIQWEKRILKTPEELFEAACFRAVTAAMQSKKDGHDTAKLSQIDADKAMEWLKRAVTAGYNNQDQLKNHVSLAHLRQREDFNKLLQSLSEHSKPQTNVPQIISVEKVGKDYDLSSLNWGFKYDNESNTPRRSWLSQPVDESWRTIRIGMSWDRQGYTFNQGSVWYRIELTIPQNWLPADYYLNCSGIDDYAEFYVNGKPVGSMGNWSVGRGAFATPVTIAIRGFRPGQKVQLAVRVYNTGGSGGIHLPIILSQSPQDLAAQYRQFLSDAELRLNQELKLLKPNEGNLYSFRDGVALAWEALQQPVKAEPYLRSNVEAVQSNKYHELYPGVTLIALSENLIKQLRWNDAESYLRSSLAIQVSKQPEAWTTYYCKSRLGHVLVKQKKNAEGEELLLQGHQGLMARESIIPQATSQLLTSIESLIQFYTETNKPDEANKWQAEKSKFTAELEKSKK